ncbi:MULTISPECIES: dihydrofolate reductase [unclassified Sphingopyxis]|jgi:dihydrofolate reductase|uniref:dihydrofolate reductase n=1 Tax=unclassified Sphingopyxis TaxID=2614943 RepID=UPI0006BF916E|nr:MULTISPECIES: dihydrofolate reductase [unclassified Sphingopyxis]USI77069.1 dihydrofolate reductase [Sphingopyxis sp. USTB-05]GAO80476.1 dihydrofolate reductase [Sphingopyxis sp. C-1]
MNRPEITLILARAANGVIGADGKMAWHLPADLRRFKQLTMGRPMIMGRKTFDSLPAILEGRRHIVLTRDPDWQDEGAEPVATIEEALKLANAPHVMVIGGAEIYRLFLPLADRIELTEVALEPNGNAAIDYPAAADWREIAREDHPADDAGRPAYSFVTLTRK